MSISLATRGYICEVRQIEVSGPFPIVGPPPTGVLAGPYDPAAATASAADDVNIKPADDGAKVLGSEDSATIIIKPCS